MSSPSSDNINAWLARQSIDGVQFGHNDLVTILAGEHAGMVGSLVGIEQVEPEVIFRVEVDTGFEVAAKQSEIELIASGDGT